MAQVAKLLAQGTLPTAVSTIYVCPEGKSCAFTLLLVVNIDVATRGYAFYLAPPTGVASGGTTLVNAATIAANTPPVVFPVTGMILTQGFQLFGAATAANGIAIHLFGIEYDP